MSVRACRKLGGREAILNIGSAVVRTRLAGEAGGGAVSPFACGVWATFRREVRQGTFLRRMAERVSAVIGFEAVHGRPRMFLKTVLYRPLPSM